MTYQVSEDGIAVNASDEILLFPDKKTPTPDEDGVIMYYELLNSIDSKNIYWREKLGEGIKENFKDVTFPKAILTDFPKGYKLYAHRKKYPKKDERTDYYLFGRHKFRSPNEFLPHLLWLISNKSGQCHCKYCTKSLTTSGQRVFANKAKRQRDVDTPNEAPTEPKRVTRSNSVKSTNNRKMFTGNPNNQRKNTRKKRISKTVELEKNLPPPTSKYFVFRGGEIVWLAIKDVLNDKISAECNKILSIEYWPAIVGSVTPQGDSESYESIIYTVKPLILHENKNVTIDSLRPWLIRGLNESLLNSNNRFTRSLLNIELDEATPEQIVEIYFKAIQKASEIAKVFTPMYQYDYHKKGAKKEHHGIHYKAIYFGAELIYEDDIVRLLPEEPKNQSGLVDDNHSESYLQITSIFEDLKKSIHITGDLYERGKLLEKNEYEWIPKNTLDEEYTVDVVDIAGRFYPMYSNITESFECELLKTFENRMLLLGDDVPPIITTPPIVTPREPDTQTLHKTVTPTKKQVAKRSSPLPLTLTESNLLKSDHTTTFSFLQNETIISNEKEIMIKQSDRSPIKFLDIEKKYTRKSDDIDLPPLVVSPDTPTFDTDEEDDGLNKLMQNNGDKKI